MLFPSFFLLAPLHNQCQTLHFVCDLTLYVETGHLPNSDLGFLVLVSQNCEKIENYAFSWETDTHMC